MSATTYGWIALAAPVAGVAFAAFVGPGVSRRVTGWVCSGAILIAFAAAIGALAELLGADAEDRVHTSTGWTWLTAGDFETSATILVDPLSVVMLLVVTGVGFLIHAYSVGYMHGDRETRRFFAYLNFFVFAMLVLVLAGDFVFLLVGWGLVGLASYLLIGFWWERPSAVAAAKKAFIMNAVGDVGMLLALFVIWDNTGTLDYLEVFAAVPTSIGAGSDTAFWVAILLLVGAIAKSAQIPLHTWLPDAMEGPTPVSALIHAATMVTAGVYLVARMWPFYENAPEVADIVAVIGVATLVMAGLIALVQTDIKRVIAYSTMSQIGYMFAAVGIGAYSAGMFHLVTHAFFKALLFLGAGVVIHALHEEQDIHRMGGMSRFLPFTSILMWIGALALIGIPPFSGAFSKDLVLAHALAEGGAVGYLVWGLGLFGALLTALYTGRMMFTVFGGQPSEYAARVAPQHTARGEGPISMLWTILVLAIGALLVGLLEIPHVSSVATGFLEPSLVEGSEPTLGQDLFTSALAVGIGIGGLVVAYALWGKRSTAPRRLAVTTAPAEGVLQHKFGWDALYALVFERPLVAFARTAGRLWELPVIGGGVALTGGFARWAAGLLSLGQTGIVRTYAAVFAIGVTVLAVWFLAGSGSL